MARVCVCVCVHLPLIEDDPADSSDCSDSERVGPSFALFRKRPRARPAAIRTRCSRDGRVIGGRRVAVANGEALIRDVDLFRVFAFRLARGSERETERDREAARDPRLKGPRRLLCLLFPFPWLPVALLQTLERDRRAQDPRARN